MAIRVYKPTSPARRFTSVTDYSILTKKEPERSLTTDLRKRAGKFHRVIRDLGFLRRDLLQQLIGLEHFRGKHRLQQHSGRNARAGHVEIKTGKRF